jgi:hypothetical protein
MQIHRKSNYLGVRRVVPPCSVAVLIWLGWRILASQDVPQAKRWLPSLPGLAGILATGVVWWPAIFGV